MTMVTSGGPNLYVHKDFLPFVTILREEASFHLRSPRILSYD